MSQNSIPNPFPNIEWSRIGSPQYIDIKALYITEESAAALLQSNKEPTGFHLSAPPSPLTCHLSEAYAPSTGNCKEALSTALLEGVHLYRDMAMRRILIIGFLLLLPGCETVEAERLDKDRFRIKSSIVQLALGTPGYQGATANAAHLASQKCPQGWTKLRDEVQVIKGSKFVVWDIRCK